MQVLIGSFNQEKSLVGAYFVIAKPSFPALVAMDNWGMSSTSSLSSSSYITADKNIANSSSNFLCLETMERRNIKRS